MPKVINLRDTKGKVPKGAVLVDRRTKWGNPYMIGRDGTREEVVSKFRQWFRHEPQEWPDPKELRGHDLACWCAPEACHADVLLELANA